MHSLKVSTNICLWEFVSSSWQCVQAQFKSDMKLYLYTYIRQKHIVSINIPYRKNLYCWLKRKFWETVCSIILSVECQISFNRILITSQCQTSFNRILITNVVFFHIKLEILILNIIKKLLSIHLNAIQISRKETTEKWFEILNMLNTELTISCFPLYSSQNLTPPCPCSSRKESKEIIHIIAETLVRLCPTLIKFASVYNMYTNAVLKWYLINYFHVHIKLQVYQ